MVLCCCLNQIMPPMVALSHTHPHSFTARRPPSKQSARSALASHQTTPVDIPHNPIGGTRLHKVPMERQHVDRGYRILQTPTTHVGTSPFLLCMGVGTTDNTLPTQTNDAIWCVIHLQVLHCCGMCRTSCHKIKCL